MANVLIMEPRLSDAATLTASASAPNSPVAGLQRMQLYEVWRPDSLTPWIEIDLGAARDVRALALISVAAREVADSAAEGGFRAEGTASADATWRLRGADASGDLTSAPDYDSGTLGFRQAGADDTMPVVTGFHWAAAGTAPRQHRYWRIDFADEGNAAGFVDFGRLYISDAQPFQINASWGAGVGFEDPSRVNRSAAGGAHAIQRAPLPYLDFTVGFGSEAEMFGTALRLDRRRGISRDVLALLDHAHADHAAQRTVYGTMETLAPVVISAFNIRAKRFRIKGINP